MIIAALAASVLLWLNAEHGSFRFTPVRLGPLSLFAAFGLAWVAALLTRRLRTQWARIVGGVCIAVLGLVTCFAMLAFPLFPMLGFPATELVQRLPMNGYDVTLYRHNCGAICHYGLWLQQEWPVAPGIVRVRRVRGWYPASQGTVRRIDRDRVHVSVLPYAPSRGQTPSEVRIDLDPRMFPVAIGRSPHN